MATLWSSSSDVVWATVWARYDLVLQSMHSDLVALDTWYVDSYPPILRAREPQPYMTQEELKKLMQWKLKKGKWRPQLMKYISELTVSEVKQASLTGYSEIKRGNLRAATEAFCALKGVSYIDLSEQSHRWNDENGLSMKVGPATASAMLAAYDESVPFMSDEALEAIAAIIGPRKYTLPHFLIFTEQLRAKAKWLNEQRASNGHGKSVDTRVWTAQRVQCCLYVAAHDVAVCDLSSSPQNAISAIAKRQHEMPFRVKKRNLKKKDVPVDDHETLRRSQRKRVCQ
ncbi:hypothetical protein CCR75_000527 [Bremia lactucae]|uniref:Uncharacterized protein n=1 Tax=Bremia lactucae TaxID=4779 RepID=A0A976IK25_BRELC|nr:hypothetical protein CCR75_000527 [Bremia lactucae]